MTSIPFCVLERPFMVWGDDLAGDNVHFLERIDAALYYRTAHGLLNGADPSTDEDPSTEDPEGEDQGRKDVSSLSRLLWHHGIETLVMMLGPTCRPRRPPTHISSNAGPRTPLAWPDCCSRSAGPATAD